MWLEPSEVSKGKFNMGDGEEVGSGQVMADTPLLAKGKSCLPWFSQWGDSAGNSESHRRKGLLLWEGFGIDACKKEKKTSVHLLYKYVRTYTWTQI